MGNRWDRLNLNGNERIVRTGTLYISATVQVYYKIGDEDFFYKKPIFSLAHNLKYGIIDIGI